MLGKPLVFVASRAGIGARVAAGGGDCGGAEACCDVKSMCEGGS